MSKIIFGIQILLSVLLIAAVLLQTRTGGVGGIFGGGENIYAVRRGAEKFLYQATIILTVLFLGTAVAALYVR